MFILYNVYIEDILLWYIVFVWHIYVHIGLQILCWIYNYMHKCDENFALTIIKLYMMSGIWCINVFCIDGCVEVLLLTCWREDGWVKDTFEQTVKMSTYLLAMIICDFTYTERNTTSGVCILGKAEFFWMLQSYVAFCCGRDFNASSALSHIEAFIHG